MMYSLQVPDQNRGKADMDLAISITKSILALLVRGKIITTNYILPGYPKKINKKTILQANHNINYTYV